MKFKQFYLQCLAHASYYIGSEGEAAIIDPQRDIDQYLEEAEANGQKIKYIIETHSHADFVSGHIELAKRTGAEIVYGRRAETEFPTLKVKDGDELELGNITLSFLETPGHTPEGITILAKNNAEPDEPVKMFTGDTLFIGDVGRPDLVGSKGFTAEEMAGMMYDSLHEKIMPLPDETEVYPAHGAGSQCGKNLSTETWSTLGNQKQFNYALQPMERDEFIRILSSDLPTPPMYFPKSAAQNLKGAPTLEELPKPSILSSEELNRFDGIVLDVREREEFGAGHVPGSTNIGLAGQFASWAGTLIPIGEPVVIAADYQDQVDEAVLRLARVGHENVKGYVLMNGYDGEVNKTEQVSVDNVRELLSNDVQFVDVRRVAEHANGHAKGAVNIPLDELATRASDLDPKKPTYVICQTGYRSSVGASILERAGVNEVYNVTGGTSAWIDSGFESEASETACAVG